MEQEIKQIFEPDDILKCPHCGEVAELDRNGKPKIICDRVGDILRLWYEPVSDIGDILWKRDTNCSSCGKKFDIEIVFRVTK